MVDELDNEVADAIRQAITEALTAEREKNAINEEKFAEWFCREIPPGTVIANPKWWVPKILHAMKKKQ